MVRLTTQVSLTLFNLLVKVAAADSVTYGVTSSEETLKILQRRQTTCPATNSVSCQAVDPKLPSNFCCQSNTTCYSLDSSSSALCCPSGRSCEAVATIECDVSLQDPTKSNTAPILTTRLNDKLSQCSGSSKCCPFGYTCATGNDGSAICRIIASKAITQPPSSVTSWATPSLSSTASSKATQVSNNPFPPTVFLAGFFPGALVGALGVLAWVIISGRHRKPDDNASTKSSVFKKRPSISGPTQMGYQSARADFLRKSTKSARSVFAKRQSGEGTPGLPFDNWKITAHGERNRAPDLNTEATYPAEPMMLQAPGSAVPRPMKTVPVTPQRQIYGNQGETILVYTPRETEPSSATVAPLRGMHSRDRSRSSATGNSFAPDRSVNTNARSKMQPNQTPAHVHDQVYETLTPARYDAASVQRRPRVGNDGQQSRPETTFTTMLEAINFPDPLHHQPPVPSLPNQYR